MKTWHLSQIKTDGVDNDLVLQHGLIKVDTDMDALRTRIDCALQVIKGEVSDDSQGVDYFGVIFSGAPLEIKVQEICRVINNVEGVNSVKFIQATTDAKDRSLTFEFTIESVFGQLDYEKTFENI